MNDATISWTSSNPILVNNNGEITRPEEESEWVILTATIICNEIEAKKEFRVRVVKNLYVDYNINYIEDFDSLEYLYAFNDGESEDDLSIYLKDDNTIELISGAYTDMIIDSPDEAILSLYQVETLLGMNEPKDELVWIGTANDGTSIRYRFQQVYQGIPVYAREVTVMTDYEGKTVVLRSGYKKDIEISPEPKLSSMDAIEIANVNGFTKASIDRLYVYVDREPELVWNIYAVDSDQKAYSLLVSANDGEVVLKEPVQIYNMVPTKEGFEVNECENDYRLEDTNRQIETYRYYGDDYIVACDDNDWSDDVYKKPIAGYTNVIQVYDYFKKNYSKKINRKIKIYVDSVQDYSEYGIDIDTGNIVLGFSNKDAYSIETVAHEYTHAIVADETNLGTTGIQGSIHEGYADIFGELLEGSDDWIALKDDEINRRNIKDPYNTENPVSVSGKYYGNPDDDYDKGNVHLNSTIISHTFWNMYDMGIKDKKILEKLWYKSILIGYDGSDTTFQSVLISVLASATALKMSSNERAIIKEAFHQAGITDNRIGRVTGTNVWSGKIYEVDNDLNISNNKVLKGVNIIIQKNSYTKFEMTTDDTGVFYFPDLLPGTYTLIATKRGYLDLKTQLYIGGTDRNYYSTFELIPDANAGIGTASGIIRDAITGQGIKGLTLEIRRGMNVKSGTSTEVETDENGQYITPGLGTGYYCIKIYDKNKKYLTDYFNVKILGSMGNIGNQDAVVSTKLSKDQIRIVLEWGALPYDLDSHLVGPNSLHVFYGDKNYTDSEMFVELDIDDTNSYGPETITLNNLQEGIYSFYVYNYSGTPSITKSNANVKVYFANKTEPAYIFSVPNVGNGLQWNVFTYDTRTRKITTINKLSQ